MSEMGALPPVERLRPGGNVTRCLTRSAQEAARMSDREREKERERENGMR